MEIKTQTQLRIYLFNAFKNNTFISSGIQKTAAQFLMTQKLFLFEPIQNGSGRKQWKRIPLNTLERSANGFIIPFKNNLMIGTRVYHWVFVRSLFNQCIDKVVDINNIEFKVYREFDKYLIENEKVSDNKIAEWKSILEIPTTVFLENTFGDYSICTRWEFWSKGLKKGVPFIQIDEDMDFDHQTAWHSYSYNGTIVHLIYSRESDFQFQLNDARFLLKADGSFSLLKPKSVNKSQQFNAVSVQGKNLLNNGYNDFSETLYIGDRSGETATFLIEGKPLRDLNLL